MLHTNSAYLIKLYNKFQLILQISILYTRKEKPASNEERLRAFIYIKMLRRDKESVCMTTKLISEFIHFIHNCVLNITRKPFVICLLNCPQSTSSTVGPLPCDWLLCSPFIFCPSPPLYMFVITGFATCSNSFR